MARDDEVLRWCMSRLGARPSTARDAEVRKDVAARRLILRLQELSGGGLPRWHSDANVFDRATLQRFVDYIDAHLRLAPTLTASAVMAALSQSHFTRLFADLTGMTPAKCRRQFRRTVG